MILKGNMDIHIDEIKKQHFDIQRAVKFMTDKFLEADGTQKKLHTQKPAVMHSLRTGLVLFEYGYEKDLVIAGLLHDVMEDADVTHEEIADKFGRRVADIVQAVSVDRSITDGAARHQDLHKREIALGKDAIIVAIADHLENIPFLKYAKDREEYETVKSRWLVFLNEVAVYAKEEPIYIEYKKQMENLPELAQNS